MALSAQSAEVTARVEGRLKRLAVREGDRVKEGAELGVLELKEEEQLLAVAEAALAVARAEELRARVSVDEKKDLLARAELPAAGVLPAQEVAQARFQHQMAVADLEAARARLQQRQAELEQARARLAEGRLRSPFDGVVTARYLSVGALVRVGTPILRVIQDKDGWVRFAIPEGQVRDLAVGASVVVRPKAGEALLRAKVTSIAAEVDAASRMVFATAVQDTGSTDMRFTFGEVVRVRPEADGGGATTESAPCVSQ
ncbi:MULTISPECIES: efflux RND transporter periplasmic adaptor subunit [Corallococcus]|uniref:efflux RND transporter periplasmic adaptor subunit n=1 Tax=Corallococcus TaxID=83461 RepID=UPI00131507C7|nr:MULTISPECIES: efflux RND transporter periplasmic adaptor subunit [Corallococcus]